MDRMLYIAMSGAKETMLSQANNANNLANADTPGFLKDLNQFRSMPVFGDGFPTRVDAMSERPRIDFDHGTHQETSDDLDIAVRGPGFIAVQPPEGGEAYTRRGDLKTDANGILTNGDDLPVLGENGPIALPPDAKVEIGNDGTITIKPEGSQADALAVVDRIKLVAPPLEDLEKGEDGLLRLRDGGKIPADPSIEVLKGMLEGSNVNIVESLVEMIDLARRFELQVKMMKTAEETDTAAAAILRTVG
jgi:flagellar basal-body rod protein FlgF